MVSLSEHGHVGFANMRNCNPHIGSEKYKQSEHSLHKRSRKCGSFHEHQF